MYLNDIDPFVRQALVGTLDKHNTQDVNTPIKTADCRLFYILSGSGKMYIDGNTYQLLPGTAVLFSAGTEYIWEIEHVKYYAMNFDYSHSFSHIKTPFHPIRSEFFCDTHLIERPCFDDIPLLNTPLILHGVPQVGQILEQITTEFFIGGDHCDELISLLLKSAIVLIIRMAEKQTRTKEADTSLPVRDIIAYINMNYDTRISNDTIAAAFNFHSVYLNRIFKSYTGKSMHDFLINRRITAAMEMLRSQCIPISEVSKKCGFGSQYHFAKCFKLRTGMTPSDYRRMNFL